MIRLYIIYDIYNTIDLDLVTCIRGREASWCCTCITPGRDWLGPLTAWRAGPGLLAAQTWP